MTKGEVLGWVGNVGKVIRGQDNRGWELSRGWVSESCHDVVRILCLFLLDLCLLQLHLVELKFQTSEVLFNRVIWLWGRNWTRWTGFILNVCTLLELSFKEGDCVMEMLCLCLQLQVSALQDCILVLEKLKLVVSGDLVGRSAHLRLALLGFFWSSTLRWDLNISRRSW